MNDKTDLTGRRFGKLVVIGDSGARKNWSILWRCNCDCGGETLAVGSFLTGNSITNCGCIPKKRKVYGAAEDLTGQQFGQLTALYWVENDRHKNTRWMCRCSCGNMRIVQAAKLKNGATQSCGCKRQNAFTGKDLTRQRFGRLEALSSILILYRRVFFPLSWQGIYPLSRSHFALRLLMWQMRYSWSALIISGYSS